MLALVAVLPASGCTMNACPAVGYDYFGPAVVRFDPALPVEATVESCFGSGCNPVAVSIAASGEWEVPQETPYILTDSIAAGDIRDLRVIASIRGETLADATYEIPILMEPEGVFGQCPGPFSFGPVVIEWEP